MEEWYLEIVESLADIDFPTTLTSIGGNAFLNCTGLESITVPEGCNNSWIRNFPRMFKI